MGETNDSVDQLRGREVPWLVADLEDDRFEYCEALAERFERRFPQKTSAEAADALGSTSPVWEPYRTFGTAEPLQTCARADPIVTDIDQPGVGVNLAPSSPLTLKSTSTTARPAPLLGEHMAEVLAHGVGLDASQGGEPHGECFAAAGGRGSDAPVNRGAP